MITLADPRACCRQCHPAALDPLALVQWLGLARGFAEAVALLAGGPIPPTRAGAATWGGPYHCSSTTRPI